MSKKIIIIGAGVSGIACAITLKKLGLESLLLEGDQRVGGRIKTDRNDEGFLFDRGFQVLLNSYPELNHFLDLKKLQLKNFNSGALIYAEGSNRLLANPFKHSHLVFKSLFTDLATFKDKLLIPSLMVKALSVLELRNLKGQTTHDFLKEFGFSDRFISKFWKPFLTGVYLDSTLSLDANYFLFLLRSFSLGSVSIPENGMEEIPKQMANGLDPLSIKTSCKVREIHRNHVILESGETLEADIVIKAFNAAHENYRSVSTYYFCTSQKLDWKKWLLLIPPGLGFNINSLTLLSEVSKAYAPQGQTLISASVVGNENPISANQIRDEVIQISKFNLKLQHLRTETVKHALPYLRKDLKKEFSFDQGVYECGDHWSAPSLNGALRSGRLTGIELGLQLQSNFINI